MQAVPDNVPLPQALSYETQAMCAKFEEHRLLMPIVLHRMIQLMVQPKIFYCYISSYIFSYISFIMSVYGLKHYQS